MPAAVRALTASSTSVVGGAVVLPARHQPSGPWLPVPVSGSQTPARQYWLRSTALLVVASPSAHALPAPQGWLLDLGPGSRVPLTG